MQERPGRQPIFVELIKSLMPITTMGWAMFVGVIVWFVNWVLSDSLTIWGSRALKLVFDIASALAVIPLIYFSISGARWVTQHLLWRLRRRLIVTYLLIGGLPLLLLLLLVVLIGWVVVMQSSAGLVDKQIEGYLEQSHNSALAISNDLAEITEDRWQSEQMRRRLQERANFLAPIFPNVTLRLKEAGGVDVSVKGISSEGNQLPSNFEVSDIISPDWLQASEFHGLVLEENPAGERKVFARHIVKLRRPSQTVFQLSYPIGEALCEHMKHTTDLIVLPGQALTPLMLTPSGAKVDETERLAIKKPEEVISIPTGVPIFKKVADWRTGVERERDILMVDSSFLSPGSILLRVQQFKTGTIFGNVIFVVIATLAVIIFLIALSAVISAFFLTRSITGAVHYLYEGTQRVEGGDFDHEIEITGRDQLATLSSSFNQMTRSIRDLLRVSAEKQRLDQEMKIASQVQARLFPRSTPKTALLDFAPGICIPARSVSGDYYDFLEVSPEVIGVVVADVCGKGVSAALMMANLQANLRGRVQAYHDAYDYKLGLAATAIEPQPHHVRRIVHQVNQQVTASMLDSSFITFFYAEIDQRHSTLRYTNAGHNPPLLLRTGDDGQKRIEKLDQGGTVLGLFLDAEYEDAELQLVSGDVLAAFTDGLIEARSPEGEEFGEERVIESLIANAELPASEIEKCILSSVKEWTNDSEQEDDLTLVILKVK
jgi:sigma-B regulation protein RsbU (phosphoserine phosphatase)